MSDPTHPWYEVAEIDIIPTPCVLVYPDRIEANIRRMIQAVKDVHQLRPHVKTHKMPPIVQMQLAAGIHRFKTATIGEAEMTAAAGANDVLVAYPMVGPNIGRFVELKHQFPDCRFSCLVDDSQSLHRLNDAAIDGGQTVGVFIDVDVGMHRSGLLPSEIFSFADRLPSLSGIRLLGLHAYDGHIHGESGPSLDAAIRSCFSDVFDAFTILNSRFPGPLKLIAGGTPTSFRLSELSPVQVEVGAGTTLLWDGGQDHLSPGMDFEVAAMVVCRIISRPGADRLCVDLGHKAVASEMPTPRVSFPQLPNAQCTLHSEEHLVIQSPSANRFSVGDVLYGIPRHICPTIALHPQVGVVQQNHLVDQWVVAGRDRQITI